MHYLAKAFANQIADGLQGKSLLSCSRWSAKRRIMGAPFPGPYSWKYHPWVKEILDSKAPFNVTLKSAQAGFTEVGINRAFYTLDVCKRDVLYVLPTLGNATDFSKARFGGALESSPYIKSLFTATNTVGLKQAGAQNLYIRGSRGGSNLKSVPASVLILDEYDEMSMEAVALALERLSGQLHKEVWFISTPTIPQFGVHKEYLLSTQEHFTFKCPSCSKRTELVWPDCIEIVGEGVNDPRCKESYLKCKECKNKLNHEDKPDFLKSGKWEATNTNGDPDRRGFHISQLYSFTVRPSELVVAHFKGFGDEYFNAEFNRSKLGLPFIGEGAQVTEDQIEASIRPHTTKDARPRRGGRLITMGCDQGKTGYYVVVEWFLTSKPGKDINSAAFGRILDLGRFDQNNSGFTKPSELMAEWQVLGCVTDADPEIGEARQFAKKFRKFAWLCRYRKGVTGNEFSISDEDTGAPIATVDRTYWLGMALGRFRTGRIELPRDVTQEFKDHVRALVQTYAKDDLGNPYSTYVSTGADHFGHALTYAEIALKLAPALNSSGNITGI